MTVRIRAATEEDLPFLAPNDPHIKRDELERIIQAGRVLVAEEDQRPVGLARWGLFWDEIPFLNMLFVLPAHRGRGLGTRLIGEWEAEQRATAPSSPRRWRANRHSTCIAALATPTSGS